MTGHKRSSCLFARAGKRLTALMRRSFTASPSLLSGRIGTSSITSGRGAAWSASAATLKKLLNYNLTTAQESISKVPKSPYLITTKMLSKARASRKRGATLQRRTVRSPLHARPFDAGGKPFREPPPDVPAAFLQVAQISVDMLKASDGIFDASVGARSNETSGKAIMARQQEGDTATFDYQDALSRGIQITGDLILRALHKVYDTQRVMRVIGKDGSERLETLYQDVQDKQTGRVVRINDLGKGKYDLTSSSGPSYDTLRMEFVDALTQMSQGNPMIAQAVPDLLMKAFDFPGAEEAAERLKMMLPPQIQQQMAEGKGYASGGHAGDAAGPDDDGAGPAAADDD